MILHHSKTKSPTIGKQTRDESVQTKRRQVLLHAEPREPIRNLSGMSTTQTSNTLLHPCVAPRLLAALGGIVQGDGVQVQHDLVDLVPVGAVGDLHLVRAGAVELDRHLALQVVDVRPAGVLENVEGVAEHLDEASVLAVRVRGPEPAASGKYSQLSLACRSRRRGTGASAP